MRPISPARPPTSTSDFLLFTSRTLHLSAARPLPRSSLLRFGKGGSRVYSQNPQAVFSAKLTKRSVFRRITRRLTQNCHVFMALFTLRSKELSPKNTPLTPQNSPNDAFMRTQYSRIPHNTPQQVRNHVHQRLESFDSRGRMTKPDSFQANVRPLKQTPRTAFRNPGRLSSFFRSVSHRGKLSLSICSF